MTQPPHLPPPGPNPNIYTGPVNVEPVPLPNERLSAEQWDQDRLNLDSLISQLHNTHETEAEHNLTVSSGLYNNAPTLEQMQRQQILDQRSQIETSIADLARNSDTSAILSRLGYNRDSAERSRDEAADVVSRRTDSARGARRDATSTHVDYNTVTLDATRAPLTPDQKARSQKAISESLYTAAKNKTDARKSAEMRDRAVLRRDRIDGYDVSVQNIVDTVEQEQSLHVTEARRINSLLHQELRAWGLNQAPAPGQEDYIRDGLEAYADLLSDPDALSVHDSARAEHVGNYVRLRYRVEARGINEVGTSATYEPDGGIRVNPGDPEETILYPNGDTIRVGAGEVTRLRPDGNEPTDADLQTANLVEPADLPAGATTAQLVARWEERRTPETAETAHTALSEVTTRLGERDVRLTETAATLQEQISNTQGTITATDGQIAMNQGTLSTNRQRLHNLRTSTARTPEEDTELQQLDDETQTLDTQTQELILERQRLAQAEVQLRADRAQAIADQRQVRAQRNPILYTQGFLEVGARRPETPQMSRGRRIGNMLLRRTVDTVVPSEPLLQSDGSIIWNNVTMNGRRDNWRVYPNGEAVRYDPAHGDVQHRSDGTPI